MSDVYSGEWVVSRILEDRAERFPDRRFATSHDGDLTFGGLADGAARFAAGLSGLGIRPGDRVASMLPATLDYLMVWFGIVWAGAVDVPVNTENRGEFLRHVIDDSGAEVVVVWDRWAHRLGEIDLPRVRHIVVVGDEDGDAVAVAGQPAAAHPFPELMAATPAPRVARAEGDLVYVMYTSGTTGPSKGVMHVNRSALNNTHPWLEIVGLEASDVAYSMFPLFHVTARSAIVSSTLWAGASLVLRDGFSRTGFWADVAATGATWFGYMGAVIHLLHGEPESEQDSAHRATRAFGAAAPPAIVADFERRFGVRLLETYGSTELGPATAPSAEHRRIGTQGRALPHVVVEIHDEADRAVPTGVEGEIVVRPAVPYGIFQGYWGRSEDTVEAFRNLWFHTGDGGRLDEDGFLTFTDRIKDSIRRRGENISSFEVERAVAAHPAVLECGAYAVPSELTEDDVMVAVVPAAGGLTAEDLFAHCIATMPRFAVPRYVRFVDALPKTPSHRIRKYVLRAEGVTRDTIDRDALGIVVPRD